MTAQLDIDLSTITDNIDDRQVEFTGRVDGDDYAFAVKYGVLEALSGEPPQGDAAILFGAFVDDIGAATLVALSRDSDAPRILVSENDLAA